MRSTTKFCVERYQKSLEPFHPLQLLFTFLTSVFLPESSYLIGQFTGNIHYSFVTDDSQFYINIFIIKKKEENVGRCVNVEQS